MMIDFGAADADTSPLGMIYKYKLSNTYTCVTNGKQEPHQEIR